MCVFTAGLRVETPARHTRGIQKSRYFLGGEQLWDGIVILFCVKSTAIYLSRKNFGWFPPRLKS